MLATDHIVTKLRSFSCIHQMAPVFTTSNTSSIAHTRAAPKWYIYRLAIFEKKSGNKTYKIYFMFEKWPIPKILS